MSTSEAPPEPTSTQTPIGRVETDMFCSACHYNLHGLNVFRDDRLDIPILRCPECGKFHAAGIATGAGRIWLGRLARMLITLWFVFLIVALVLCGLAFFIENLIGLEIFIHRNWDSGFSRMTLRESNAGDWASIAGYYFSCAMMLGSVTLTGFILGSFLSVFLWHVKPKTWLLVSLFLPLIVAMLVWGIYINDMRGSGMTNAMKLATWTLTRLFLLEFVGVTIGVYFGRAAARLVLRAILTRKLLQHVRFLWEVDGRDPPELHA